MAENSPWIPQENGTYLPSADLVRKVRENPDKFPNAVEDFTAVSGLPREEVEAILNNPLREGGSFGFLPSFSGPKMLLDASEGALRGAEWAARKLFNEEAGDAVGSVADSVDPAFETEKGSVERLQEVAGQAAPAIAAGIAGGGVVAGGIAGAGVSTLTFGDEDNLMNLANDYADGLVPDFLTIQEDDGADARALKNLSANLIVDLAMAGLGHGIAKVYRIFRETPSGFADMDTLKALGDEYGIPLRETEGATAAANDAIQTVARRAVDEQPSAVEVVKIRKAAAKDKLLEDIAAKELGHPVVKSSGEGASVPEDVARAFRQETLGPINRLLNRSSEVNVGRAGRIEDFRGVEGGYQVYASHTEEVLKALSTNNIPDVLRLIRQIDELPQASTVGHTYKTAVLNASLQRLDDNFEAIIHRIREDPSLVTKRAWKELAAEYHANKVRLAEMYREIGSSSSYAFLNRKGVKFDDRALTQLAETEDELIKQLKEQGYNLFSSRAEFVASKALTLDEMGYDTLQVMDELHKMFDEFDAARAGVIDNMKSNNLSKLSKAEKEALENSFMRALHDFHSSALLGQPSTAMLEVSSNFLNNLTLPFTEHVLTKGNVRRAFREYSGYAAAWGRGWETFKKAYMAGKSVTDDFDILDGAHASKLDYEELARKNNWAGYVFMRLWKFAADLSIAASESQKAWRGMGVAYADGFELALRQGATKPQAKKMALEYANNAFTPEGAFKDAALKLDVQQTSWQSVLDTRYATGKITQSIDNLRNSTSPYVAVPARAAVPFWRTLINIASHSLQTVQPVPAVVLKGFAKTPYAGKMVKLAKFMDDFTGSNGYAAQQRAIGRQRLGYTMLATGWALMETGAIDITGPSGYKRWDAKIAEMQEYPASSLIIGDTAIDLTRLLPFSAPLLLLGVMKDAQREDALEMQNGNWVSPDDSAYKVLTTYGTSLGILSLSLMSDAASMRGVGDLFDSVQKAVGEGDPRGIIRFGQDYLKQFTPGLIRAAGKNQGLATGDWTQDQAEGFLNEVLASAGWHTGYTKLDFLGHPVIDKGRGLDPFNMKPVKATSDPLRAEYVMLNKADDLGLMLDRPDGIYDKAFWKNLGVNSSFSDWVFGTEAPSLTQMKTKDGANAWERYRELVYKGKATGDIQKGTGRYGDRIDVGKVTVKKGENFEAALRRIIETPGYQALTPDARAKVFKTVFGIFKEHAKDHLKDNLVIDPSTFSDSRYGSPISSPSSIGETQEAGKDLAAGIQRTRGNPLDEIFSIK